MGGSVAGVGSCGCDGYLYLSLSLSSIPQKFGQYDII
jgi:hypothetical protein